MFKDKFVLIFALCSLLSAICQAQVTQEWVARYNGTYNLDDVDAGIVVDKYGNSYVTGYSSTPNGTMVATVKYNPLGANQWVKLYYDPNWQDNLAAGISIDTMGNIYVTGFSGNLFNEIYYTWLIKYDSNGDSLWVRRYYGTGQNALVKSIRTDKMGNIYITGGENQQIFIIKYNKNGDSLWTRNHIESGYSGGTANSVALDSAGNVYIGGVSWLSNLLRDYIVVKYNSNGLEQWSRTYGTPNYDEYSHRTAVDKNSNVYITGYCDSPTPINHNYLTVKYNSSGVEQWTRQYHKGDDEAWGIVVDYQDNVIVTGFAGNNYCTIKYNTQGDSLWVRTYSDTTSNPYDRAYSIIVDSLNSVYVTGRGGMYGPATTIKYSTSGIQLWKIDYPIAIGTSGQSLAIDNANNIYLQGSDWDYVTIKYSQLMGIQTISTVSPHDYRSFQNYPNPFNPKTKIKFSLPTPSKGGVQEVRLIIYDLLGRQVESLIPPLWGGKEGLQPGTYEVEWDGTNYPSGVYFYKLSAGNFTDVKKLVLLK
jgi:hypothetical protein